MEQEILKLLKDKKNTSLTGIEINDYLKLNTVEEYTKLESVLEKLMQEGKIYYSEKKKRYTPIENTNFKTGRLLVNPKGYGFVVLDPSFNEDDIYISIMNQYTPVRKCKYEELNSKVSTDVYEDVIDYAWDIGIRNAFIQEGDTASESFIPDFDCSNI